MCWGEHRYTTKLASVSVESRDQWARAMMEDGLLSAQYSEGKIRSLGTVQRAFNKQLVEVFWSASSTE